MPEKWKQVLSYEGLYEVSDLGRVKSINRSVWNGAGFRIVKERILKPFKSSHGYNFVSLTRNSDVKKFKVSWLVLEAFISKRENGIQVRHLNAIRTDDRLINLAYGTQADNEADKKLLEIDNTGERNGQAKLKESDVIEILSMIKAGFTYKKIAQYFPIKARSISDIACGRTWRHISGLN